MLEECLVTMRTEKWPRYLNRGIVSYLMKKNASSEPHCKIMFFSLSFAILKSSRNLKIKKKKKRKKRRKQMTMSNLIGVRLIQKCLMEKLLKRRKGKTHIRRPSHSMQIHVWWFTDIFTRKTINMCFLLMKRATKRSEFSLFSSKLLTIRNDP